MKGLIIKDFLNLKKSIKIYAVITVMYFFFGIANDNPFFVTGFLSAILAVTTLSLFSYDDMAKWDIYALTMPLSKEKIIQARYLMMFLLTLIGAVIGSLLSIVIALYLKKGISADLFINIEYWSLAIILVLSVMIPFVVKLGAERARLIFAVIFMIPFAIYLLFDKIIIKENAAPYKLIEALDFAQKNIQIIGPVIVLLAVVVSYFISVAIYNKKEL